MALTIKRNSMTKFQIAEKLQAPKINFQSFEIKPRFEFVI